ncbi:ParB N-terminal domain-containing protein (plasmid) [Methylobacterium radiotolerans]|jgi:ParB family transcriptional regulator, chromosome partitioning protein|uniref:ParB/RepB/Spo0J family partition protein n=1 Tax=Methylobacterium TaxID=407 RepID=UPI0005E1417A|nr:MULTISPECIES: ParB/RepB/Spo0J family partition protein [Methylobacterium]MBN6819862.1 ParB/RepB/Spo0J family partition protein [Methylobacterium organophilum]OXE43395.1 DNA-binding protein [Methylobacterium radiotolerans]GAN47324.1 ParB-like protein [Methylobacterium sp. ME121]
MANIPQKLTLAPAQPIPFNKLVLSQSNVRQVKAGESIEDLAASIERRGGLIQSLHVRPVLDEAGRETGMYEVPAGGRRYRALELLIKKKRLTRTAPIPCIVSDPSSAVLAEEISLAENIERAPLHPLDQFRAFKVMLDRGMTEETIAAAFTIPVQVVKQRLRLTAVAPALLDVFADDGMTLEQLMAFTITDDHARQVQVWEAVRGSWQKEPYQIRQRLTERTVPAGDKRALFVGVEAYEAAGGVMLRDLFQSDGGGWLHDVALLDRLVDAKLKTAAAEIAAEGWKWVEAAPALPYGHQIGLRHLKGEIVDVTAEERATIVALKVEQQKLLDAYDSAELPDAVDERLGEIEEALDELAERPLRYVPAEIARAGAFVSIRHDGRLQIQRGYVRPEDEPPAADGQGVAEPDQTESEQGQSALGSTEAAAMPTIQRSVITIGGYPVDSEPEKEDGIRPLPDRLLAELTAHRTLALREALASNPEVALTALLHKLVVDAFHHATATGCLQVTVREAHLMSATEDLADCASSRSIAERHEAWAAKVPENDDALWDWLAGLDAASRMALLAHCVSFGLNAQYEKPNPYSGFGVSEHGLKVRLGQADRLARATGLDMAAAGWRPTVATYLGRVPKARILEAVREGAGQREAQRIDHLKKADMAREAERLLADTGWLPEPLRLDLSDGISAVPDEPFHAVAAE